MSAGHGELSVEQDMCMGSGYCVRLHPRRFEIDADGVCEVLESGPGTGVGPGPVVVTEEEFDVVQEAVKVCPGGAIEFGSD